MVANLNFNYMTQTVAAGTFNVKSTGYVQGMALDDPAIRYQLRGGVLASTETLPMWGGVGISETVIPNTGTNPPDGSQGGLISRATLISATGAAGALTGFSVFNQAYGMSISTTSPVPLAGSGMQVNFFRLGCGILVPVACSAALASLEGAPISQQVSWDFVGQQLIPYQAAYNSASVSSATYTSSTGILQLTFGAAPAGTSPTVGATFSVSGLAGTGVAVLNGDWALVSSASAGTVLNLQATPSLGSLTITSSTGTLAAGGGALPVKVQEISIGESMSISYSAANNGATWNYTGNLAIIQL